MRARAAISTLIALLLLLVMAPAAKADVVASNCAGEQAVRCGFISVDYANNRLRGWAQISDQTVPDIGEVQIGNVRLYRSQTDHGPWTEVAFGNYFSGWKDESDYDYTSLESCAAGWYYRVDYRWYYRDTTGYSTNQVASSFVWHNTSC